LISIWTLNDAVQVPQRDKTQTFGFPQVKEIQKFDAGNHISFLPISPQALPIKRPRDKPLLPRGDE